MKVSELSPKQLSDITTIERVSSIFSLLGCLWISITFLSSRSFQKPINRLVFYASVGNIFTNCATIMSRDFLSNPGGAGCQVQGFFIQMFMPADAVWTLAMAANVWLTFYHKYDSDQLRSLEKWYFVLCYGIPFVPALAFCFVSGEGRGQIYGNATLWCWIGSEWEVLRLACFYGPVWLVILATIAIYLRAGKDIYKKRKQLRSFQSPKSAPSIPDPWENCKTTEVMVTSEAVTSSDTIDLQQLAPRDGPPRRAGQKIPAQKPAQSYQVTVTSQVVGPSQAQDEDEDDGRWSYQEKLYNEQQRAHARQGSVADQLELTATTSNTQQLSAPARKYPPPDSSSAAWGYTKVAVLFFLAMMITWIPSSANRVYSVVHPGHISLPLQFASAFVLPLQGFWNALIYTTTSLPAFKKVWREIREGRVSGVGLWRSVREAFGKRKEGDREAGWSIGRRGGSGKGDKYSLEETESMTELQASRPVTKDTNSR